MTSSRRMRLAVAVGAVLLVAAPSCGVDDDAAVPACEVLQRDAPGGGDGPDDPTPTVGQALGNAFVVLDRNQVFVYLEPGEEDQLAALEAEIAERPGVETTRVADVEATFADFQDLFADNEEILRGVSATDLPTSVTATTDSAEAVDDLAAWAEDRPDIFEVTTADDRETADTLMDTMVAEADRTQWQALADDLDRIQGRPEWGRRGADLVRSLLQDGDDAEPSGTTAERRAAYDELVDARRACRSGT